MHTEFLKDIDGVFREKTSVFDVCPDSQAVLNGDDVMLASMKLDKVPLFFGKSESFDVYYDVVERSDNNIKLLINNLYYLDLKTIAEYNISNVLAALCAAYAFGVSIEAAVENMKGFSFPKMRMQVIEKDGVTYVNDAYNANPYTLEKSLDIFLSFPAARKIIVLADMLELGVESKEEHEKVVCRLKNACVDKVLLLGNQMSRVCAGLEDMKIQCCETKEDVKKELDSFVKVGDAIFLKGSRYFKLETLIGEYKACYIICCIR